MEALKHRSGAAWMKLFDDRYGERDWPYASGVWGKKEWVLPNIDPENIISTKEGFADLFWAKRLGQILGLPDLWVKLLGNSHSGSFKDIGMTVLVSHVNDMISRGSRIRAIACASTGDTSAALAAYCATAGIPAIVLLPRGKVSLPQLLQPLDYNALVLSLDTDFDGCMALVKQIAMEDEGIYLANSMNPLRKEGQKTIGIEIIQEFDWEVPDVMIVPGGNLGNVTAIGNGLLMMRELGLISKLPQLVVAQAQKANPLVRAYRTGFEKIEPMRAGSTLATAIQIGDPVSMMPAIDILKQCNGIAEDATEEELANASALAGMTGLSVCPQTSTALAVLMKLLRDKTIDKDEKVVLISTANALKFTEFKLGYHQNTLGFVSERPNQAVEIPATLEAVNDALLAKIGA
jgi:threonine synthase